MTNVSLLSFLCFKFFENKTPKYTCVYTWFGVGATWYHLDKPPLQRVLPGALWHDHTAECKHRTSRSEPVPSQCLHKPLHSDRLFDLNHIQGTSRSSQRLGVSNACLYTICVLQGPFPKKRFSTAIWIENKVRASELVWLSTEHACCSVCL